MGNSTIPSHVGGDYWHLGQGHTLIHNTLLGKGKVRLSRAPLEFQVKRLSFDSTGLNKIVSNDQIFKIVTIFALNCLESQKPFDPKTLGQWCYAPKFQRWNAWVYNKIRFEKFSV